MPRRRHFFISYMIILVLTRYHFPVVYKIATYFVCARARLKMNVLAAIVFFLIMKLQTFI